MCVSYNTSKQKSKITNALQLYLTSTSAETTQVFFILVIRVQNFITILLSVLFLMNQRNFF